MLERTAGCIEPSSLRRLVPGSKKPFKTKRMLHSTFWTHGAGGLDVPPLWNILLGEYSAARDDDRKEMKASETCRPNLGFLLDFLYPAGTLTLLRHFSAMPMGWQGAKHQNTSAPRFGHRSFSSGTAVTPRNTNNSPLCATGDASPQIEHSTEVENELQAETLNSPQDVLRATQRLKNLMDSPEPRIDFEEVWRQYQLLPSDQERLVLFEVINYLSSARRRRVDAERVASLVAEIPPEERDSMIWRAGAKSLIDIDMLPEAVTLHRLALEYNEPSVTPLIISGQLRCKDWRSACETYAAHQSHIEAGKERRVSRTSFVLDLVLQKASENLPEFADLVLQCAGEMDQVYFTDLESESSSKFREFAILLASHALIPPSGTFSTNTFMFLVEFLQRWKADSPTMYKYLIRRFLKRGNVGLAITSYNHFHHFFRPHLSRDVLRSMVKAFCETHCVEGMQQVLDDWFFCFEGPDRFSYRQCMKEFARQADAATVEALFEQFAEKFCRDGAAYRFERPDTFAPLLDVHAKRGELEKVISIFEKMPSEYGVSPSLVCWNILINAYGKVQDIDGAFERFEQLLNAGLKPDHYTLGTLMGMCAVRGDREKTIELFQLAVSMEIKASPAMIGCLVLVHTQEGQLKEASEICEMALEMELACPPNTKPPLTRMWNQLLMGHVFRRDITGTNEVIQRMGELQIEFDTYTYSALLQSLATHRMGTVAHKMLTHIMPQAGVEIRSFHYAILMSSFLSTGELDRVFDTYHTMLSQNIKPDTNTTIQALKASVHMDRKRMQTSLDHESRFKLAEEYLDRVIRTIDPLQVNPSIPRKGMGRDPVDIAYNTAVYRYMIYVYGVHRMMDRVQELYAEYLQAIPEKRSQTPPIRLLEGLIHANMTNEDFQGVEECWQMAFDLAKKEASSVKAGEEGGTTRILPMRKFSLALCLTSYMTALSQQKRDDEIPPVVAQVQAAGFALDAPNWNTYIQSLVRGGRVAEAFGVCEAQLMDNWAGWAHLLRRERKKRFPFDVRAQRRLPAFLRPHRKAFLFLARGWLDLNAVAAEDPASRALVERLAHECPKLMSALQTMEQTGEPDEVQILTGDDF